MKIALNVILGLVLLPAVASAADGPEIQVVDGKVSMSAQSVPLGRLLEMFDKAVGLSSNVKPELASTNISVQFTDLDVNEAVRKIFEGQPFNYLMIQGKGITVTDRALRVAATPAPIASSPFGDSQPIFTSPLQPNVPTPFTQQITVQPQQQQPQNLSGNGQTQATGVTPFGPQPTTSNTPANPNQILPGQIPPNPGALNPLISPTGQNSSVGGGFPGVQTTAPAQPAGPGTLGGATPGALPR